MNSVSHRSGSTILLVVDDFEEREFLARHVRGMGFLADQRGNLLEAREAFREAHYWLVIIHISRNGEETQQLCSEIRSQSTIPILVVTSRSEPFDEAMALEAGADDYIAAPISPRVLSSRILWEWERAHRESPIQSSVLRWDVLELVPSERLFLVNDQPVQLSLIEFEILLILLERPLHIFTRSQIIEAVPEFRGFASDHVFDNHASRIRKKIHAAGGPDVIRSIRGIGFRLAPEDQLIEPSATEDVVTGVHVHNSNRRHY